MKFLIAMMVLTSVSVYGRGSGTVRSYSDWIRRSGGHLCLKYPIMSWEQLQFRRDKIDKVITDIGNMASNVANTSEGFDAFMSTYNPKHEPYDVKPLLYQVMEHTVAIHSGLPRIGPGIESIDDYRIIRFVMPNNMPQIIDSTIELSKLENSYVPNKMWKLYNDWGSVLRKELVAALESIPQYMLTGEHGRDYKKEFFEMFDNEFDRTSTRKVYSMGGGHNDSKDLNFYYVLKNDLPELNAYGDIKESYKPRFPAKYSFLADITLPDNVAKKLEELTKFKPESM